MRTGGHFNLNEQELHINVLEMLAVCFGLKAFVKNSDTYVKILSDNTATIYSINKMDLNNFSTCRKIICDIWAWAEQSSMCITIAHIPGKYNDKADKESRKIREKNKEWILNKNAFEKIIQHFQFYPKIDLFTSRLNKKLAVFVLYRPDHETTYVNAFSLEWKIEFYAFPLFSLIDRFMQKISIEASIEILIVPYWSTQPWYSHLMKILIDNPILLSSTKNLLFHPTLAVHPIWKRLDLPSCLLSDENILT